MADRLRMACAQDGGAGRAQLRHWLVAAGQIEQAMHDGAGGGTMAAAVTDLAAELFLDGVAGQKVEARRLLGSLDAVHWFETKAEVRIPEGYAWYGLYPESHAAAAAGWTAGRRGARVLVVGLLSIGTSLGAVVAAALRRQGVAVAGRLAVRPSGHPFARQARLSAGLDSMAAVDAVLIVDEGPGLSGSSMAGVAEALLARGVKAEAIFFFPGHDRGPGGAASGAIRRWWTPERCFTAPAPQFIDATPALDWIFGGLAVVNAQLETLGEVKRARHGRLAAAGAALPSPALRHGWIAIRHEGVPLCAADLSPALLQETIVPYIALAATAGDAAVIRGGLERIAAALVAHGLDAGCGAAMLPACGALPLAGDGRLAPGHWRRLADGRVLKHDATGSDCEHDWAGAQSVLWDVAGAMVEWRMDGTQRALLRHGLRERHGLATDTRALAFHIAGYAALALARAQQGGDATAAHHHERYLREALAWLT